jgi:uncharacterized membrane protein
MFIAWNHVHPVLVHFTTALLPVSLVCDLGGKYLGRESLTSAGWWTLLFGAVGTPLTALTGWLWMSDVESSGFNDHNLSTHEWLGITLVAGFVITAVWRWRAFKLASKPGITYLAFAALVVVMLLYQGYLGGKMTLG